MTVLFAFVGLIVGYVWCAGVLLCRNITKVPIKIVAILAISVAIGMFCGLFPEYFWTMLIAAFVCMCGSIFGVSIVAVT